MANTNQDFQRVDLRSEEVQEILGKTPSWIVRWGITLLVVILIGLLIGSWYFRYPDIIASDIIITTENPPAGVVAKSTGKIDELFVTNNQVVMAGQHLAIIENPADYSSVFSLDSNLARLAPFFQHFDTALAFPLRSDYSLGAIQPDFTLFYKNYQSYLNFLRLAYHPRKIESTRKEVEKYNVYYSRLDRQRGLLQREVELANKQFSRDSTLFIRNVIPLAEFEKAEGQKIQKEHDFEQSKINLSETSIKISELEKEILDLQLQEKETRKQLENDLIESYNNLIASIATWKQNFLLRSSKNGVVSFTRYWIEDQNVTVGDLVISVIPEDQGEIIGRVDLGQKRAGKVKAGLQVNIKLENYPYMEFGIVKGFVRNVSLVPNNNKLTAEIELPDGLITNYNKELDFNQEMIGKAEIITEARPLLLRIIEPFRYVYERNLGANY
ncbi:MAG: HlyD family efflux transporter periplasmic adaptor subunit [Bacteroidales bacterium]|nr:MAG: HlyD family efflux transporter periplasmic adaptor subunit [Bacteroidales bacterium]